MLLHGVPKNREEGKLCLLFTAEPGIIVLSIIGKEGDS